MNIDILTYELKYKNDPMVLDLLRAYQDNESYRAVYGYTEEDLEQAHQEGKDFKEWEIHGYAKELENLLKNIQDDTTVEDIMDAIKDLKERMEF